MNVRKMLPVSNHVSNTHAITHQLSNTILLQYLSIAVPTKRHPVPPINDKMNKNYESHRVNDTIQKFNASKLSCSSLLNSKGCSPAQSVSVSLPVILGASVTFFLLIAGK